MRVTMKRQLVWRSGRQTVTTANPVQDADSPGKAGWPSFPGGRLPEPESAARKLVIRCVGLLAIVVSLAYLVWRALFTIDLGVWWASIPFFGLEAYALFSLALFTFSLWDIGSARPARPVNTSAARIAVLIPTYNESREVLLPTLAAAVALRPDHDTWVLDDGSRPAVKQLARELGVRYLARPQHKDAKAGNINHALSVVDAAFIAILDADHVASPDFLTNTLGYFDDPRVALVQTPQDFYNVDSFEHGQVSLEDEAPEEKACFHEEALFYRVIQPGKNRWGAAFWCGTGAVVRIAALREVGGVATGTITEDIHTTVRLHRRGWKTIYHNEVLARGLAARTAAEYQLQRLRWGIGAMQVLRLENPLTVSGLRLTQRVAYASTLLGWFEPWRSLGYLLMPLVVLFTGAVPIRAHPIAFLAAFGTTFALQQVALRLLSRGRHRMVPSVVFDLVRMTPSLLATLSLVRRSRSRFTVTPKGPLSGERRRGKVPPLLSGLVLFSLLGMVWFGLTAAGHTPLRYGVPWAAYGAAFWTTLNTMLVLTAIFRIRSLKFGTERRSSVRFKTTLAGALDGMPCTIHDLSLTGAFVSLAASQENFADLGILTINLGGSRLRLRTGVRSRHPLGSGETMFGLQLLDDQEPEQARLALALFNGQTAWRIEPNVAPESRDRARPKARVGVGTPAGAR